MQLRVNGREIPERTKHHLHLGLSQNPQALQGVGVRLLDELEVFEEVVLAAAHFVDGLLHLNLLFGERGARV